MRKLAALISRLPTASQYWQERSQDPDYAAQVMQARKQLEAAGRSLPEYRPNLSDWTPEVERLQNLQDQLAQVSAQLVGIAGGRPPTVRSGPRPLTALEVAKRDADQAGEDELVAEVKKAQETWRRLHKGGDHAASE